MKTGSLTALVRTLSAPRPIGGSGVERRGVAERRWWRVSNLFWVAVVGGVLTISDASVFSKRPGALGAWDHPLTAVLEAAFVLWFLELMIFRTGGRAELDDDGPSSVWQYLYLGVGFVATGALIVLHGDFYVLLYPDAAILIFAIDGPIVLVPLVAVAVLFLYGGGDLHRSALPYAAGDLLGLVALLAVVYSLMTALKGRAARDRLIVELQDAQRQLRAAAARDVELAALRERNRLAREMHDSIGHALVLIAVKIEAAQRLQSVDPHRAEAQWEETKGLVRGTMGELRASLAGLRVPALEDGGFTAALRDLAAATERDRDLRVSVEIAEGADCLPGPVADVLYRVTQESLANVARHARARHAGVRLSMTERDVTLDVDDDGVGLDATNANAAGRYGIVGMRERVEAANGLLAIGPRSGTRGTRVHAVVPLEVAPRD
jgi:signal transduction histidine kinase